MSILRKLKNKIVDDLIPNELKSPAGAVAAALAVDQFGIPLPGGSEIGGKKVITGPISRGIQSIFRGGSSTPVNTEIEQLKRTGQIKTDGFEGEERPRPTYSDQLNKDKSLLSRIGSGITSVGSFLLKNPELASIGAGLVAGAFSRKEDDPLYTGQSVGLNLRDIRKLANISDPRTGAAIGLNFLPETRFRQFSPEQMAETFAATAPRDFTEDRTPAQEGGIMGDQKDFEQFLQDMKERDMGRMQEQILRDFQNYMKRKKMIEQMPEAKDGGIMRMANGGMMMASDDTNERILEALFEKYLDMGLSPKDAADKAREEFDRMGMKKGKDRTMAAKGGMMDMGGMEIDLRGGGFVPMGKAEKADDVPARLSKNEFVFTADAVRAAGGGSIDKGADKMYATMKALENKVA
jgi:hypothetical protein